MNQIKIAILGQGYVGLPLTVELAMKYDVVGFDIQSEKIKLYQQGIDVTNEIGHDRLRETSAVFTDNASALDECNFYIIAVPTPIHSDKTPDLSPLIEASLLVGQYLKKGDIVVYESTVYPGTTEEICVPLLEEQSGFTLNQEFYVGYSPERINPGDKTRTLTQIQKIVAGSTPEATNKIDGVYASIIQAGTHVAPSIKVAETAKVIENAQRDINIAFMNELSMILNRMDIDMQAVLEAANTKWNFLKFTPGLVGGHCIGVDPYYLLYKANLLGHESKFISYGRELNDYMPKYVVEQFLKQFLQLHKSIEHIRIGILGVTFKEDTPDVRNSKVLEMIEELQSFDIEVVVYDPVIDGNYYGEADIPLVSKQQFKELDALIVAVPHTQFKEQLTIPQLHALMKPEAKLIFDLKAIYDKEALAQLGYTIWHF